MGQMESQLDILAPILAQLFNIFLRTGFFPNCLKIANVVLIYKNGDKTKLTNYRPISLLSCLSTILEKIVYKRVVDFLKLNEVLSPAQFGFRNNHSTIHAIVTYCHENIKQHLMIGLLMLDLRKAFNTVQHDILINKLEHYGI